MSALKLSYEFANLGGEFSQPTKIRPLKNPQLASWNPSAAALIDLQQPTDKLIALFNGESVAEGSPVASLYAGHQFGHWVAQLGDGRAAILGQVNHAAQGPWELQVKGCGPTAYSRGADGRAVLRSSIREYLCSEAMQALSIPSTRALALIDSQTPVQRESIETAALVVRMAPTHIRFGNFELFASRNQTEQVKILADYVIDHFYPECRTSHKPYVAFYRAVISKTAQMIAHWQAQGFAHGVMNTDNMSILGLTIDYGPFGFMEAYDPHLICNHSDDQGRYAFDQQPNIGLWNLGCLGNALLSLIGLEEAKAALDSYVEDYYQHYYALMYKKLGIRVAQASDKPLLTDLLNLMSDYKADYSRVFRLLSKPETHSELAAHFANCKQFKHWLSGYQARVGSLSDCTETALAHNPKYLLRNYMAQIAIDKAADGDYSEIDRLLHILQSPFDEHPDAQSYFSTTPDWAKSLRVSCSS